MSDPRANSASDKSARAPDEQPVQYPENRMLAVIDTSDQLGAAIDGLTGGGFLASEIEVMQGPSAAKKVREGTGRTGVADLAMRFVKAIGMPDDELMLKNRYADALAEGKYVISVLAPTEERQRVAAQLLRDHGAEEVRFFSRYTITSLYGAA